MGEWWSRRVAGPWAQAPIALRAYIAISLAWSLVGGVLGPGPDVIAIASFAFDVVICFFLLQGIRWIWILSIVFTVLGLVPVSALGLWLTILLTLLSLISLLLLLLPETRRYFAAEGERRAA